MSVYSYVPPDEKTRQLHIRASACFKATLASLAKPDCMVQRSYGNSTPGVPQLPIFVAHAPFLKERRAWMVAQFMAIGADDVTFVECANKNDIANLAAHEFQCLTPCWTEMTPHLMMPTTGDVRAELNRKAATADLSAFARMQQMLWSNGTISLAAKHRMAALEIVRRRLKAGIILEDDAALPIDLWQQLATISLPQDAEVFYLGSYSSSRAMSFGTSCASHYLVEPLMMRSHVRRVQVMRRNFSCFPQTIGATAYVLLQAGAVTSSRGPILDGADYAMSLHLPEKKQGRLGMFCQGADGLIHEPSISMPLRVYGPHQWMVWPATKGPMPTSLVGKNISNHLPGGTHVFG